MKTDAFLDILEDRGLVPAKVVGKLRDKIRNSDRKYTAKSVLKYLVKKDLLTQGQAKQLLETTLTVSTHVESSILGMVPLPKMPAEQNPVGDASSIFSDESETPDLVAPEVAKEAEIPTLTPVEPVKKEPPAEPESLDSQTDSFSEGLASVEADPFGELAEDASQDSMQPSGQPSGKKRKRKKKEKKENEWDSPLLLFGGGGLVLLLILGGALVLLMKHEDADAILAKAGSDFDNGSYTQAIHQYKRFVESNPRHPEISQAKVRLGMAQLWKTVEGSSNFITSLEIAQQVLDDIQDEEQFSLAQQDLASLLPKIANGLADLAEKEDDLEKIQQFVEQANTTVSFCLNTKFIPKRFRNEGKLETIKETLHRVEQSRQQNAALAEAMSNIDQAIEQSDTAAAYAIHKALVKEHSTLRGNAPLAEKVAEISAAELLGITFSAESIAAETTLPSSSTVASLALAERRGKAVAQAEGGVTVRVDGVLYNLDVADGSLRWRKFVGMAQGLDSVLLPEGDVLVVDTVRNELYRLAGETGKLVWRQSFDAPIMRPVALKGRLLVAEKSGKLFVLDATSGERTGYVQFSQSASAPPVVDRRSKWIYLVGGHSSVYTLSAEDFSCLGVYYLGHSEGSVSTPAASVLNKLIVAENSGAVTSRLHVLAIGSDGVLTQEIASKRLKGLVTTPLLTSKRRVVALTNAGQATVFEIGSGDESSAFTQLATRDALSGPAVTRFGIIQNNHLWVAGTRLSKLAITSTGSRLPLIDLDQTYEGDVFDSPLSVVGDLILHVRRPRGKAGVLVAAMDAATGKETWETALAIPPAGPPAVDALKARITAATTSGAFYLLDREAIGQRVQNSAQRLRRSRGDLPLTQAVDLGEGRLVLSAVGAKVLLHYNPSAVRSPLQKVRLAGPLSTQPVPWHNGIIVPTSLGQVFFFDAETARSKAAPFQPTISPGATYDWLSPASYGTGKDSRLLLSDGKNTLFLLRLADQPQPHLAAETEVLLSGSPLNTRLTVFADRVCAGSKDSRLVSFALPSLEEAEAIELDGNIVWGPYGSADRLLLATDSDELVCLDEKFKIVWRQPLAHGQPIGKPLWGEKDPWVLSSNDRLSRFSLQDGTETAHIVLDEPVVAGPVLFGKRFVLSSHDGALLMVDRPE